MSQPHTTPLVFPQQHNNFHPAPYHQGSAPIYRNNSSSSRVVSAPPVQNFRQYIPVNTMITVPPSPQSSHQYLSPRIQQGPFLQPRQQQNVFYPQNFHQRPLPQQQIPIRVNNAPPNNSIHLQPPQIQPSQYQQTQIKYNIKDSD